MRILVLSKVLIYEFHFDYIKNKYGNKSKKFFFFFSIKVLLADTDSLMYEIKTEDV